MESMNSFEIQCVIEGLQKENSRLSTTIQSQMDKTNDFNSERSYKSGLRDNPKWLMCTV